MIAASAQPVEYTLNMLADDIRDRRVTKLLVQDPNNAIDTEIRTSVDPSFERLRHVLKDHPIQYERDYMIMMQLVANELHTWSKRNTLC